ncbi:MAG: NAD(P)H-dependent oxidoreductase [Alphaproteobacteria bacterium]|nr:NAD(P)H-dependent oxidoreductase [Alphaproteobacteria bacterium]
MSHILIVCGSHRPKSQSRKVSDYIAGAIAKLDASVTTDVLDLFENPLPMWDGDGGYVPGKAAAWQPFSPRVQKADGFVIVSPEWAGMVPPGLKNFMLHGSPKDMGHKPAMIVAVSAGRGGSYPNNELRTSGYKNTRIVYTPDHVLVQTVNDVLNGPTEADKNDGYIRRRIDFSLKTLLTYTDAFKTIRAAGLDNPEFPNGQ